jgi:DNA polymerase III delta prime subunit
MKVDIKINSEHIKDDFSKHLKLDGNNRILFTAPFGTGKSTFLNEVSNDLADEFFFLKIYPVNYCVAKNEDVFELIKFDLLLQLMGVYKDEIRLTKDDFSLLLKSQVFIMERMKYMPLLYAVIGLSEKIGQSATELLKAMESTIKDFNDFSEEMKIDEQKEITAYLNKIEKQTGNINEMDNISQLIADLIRRIKTNRKKQNDDGEVSPQSVLIIDDLDRLDPDHTFRLFNIFSAHYIEVNDDNKFGFDKVIFVCDVDNIRRIFHHKYGQGVDFSGYIDKFFSFQPYDFDNRRFVKDKINELLISIPYSKTNKIGLISSSEFSEGLEWLIFSLLEQRFLNLRMLLQYPPISIPNYKFQVNGRNVYEFKDYPILSLFYVLKVFYLSFPVVREKLELLFNSNNRDSIPMANPDSFVNTKSISNLIASYCLPFLLPKSSMFSNLFHSEGEQNIFVPEFDITVYYYFDRYYEGKVKFSKATKRESEIEVEINPYEFLLVTFDNCLKMGALK